MNKFDSFEQAYYYLLKNDINNVVITNPRKCLIYKENLKALIGEFICNMQGKNDLEMLSHYISAYSKVSDDNDTVNGMIGNRIFKYDSMFDIYQNENKEFVCEHIVCDQFEECINTLKENDIYNMSIYNRVFDKHTKHPAEIENLLFYVEDNKLNLTINTNVFDIYIRFPYLALFVSNLMSILCAKLNLQLGVNLQLGIVNINFGYIIITNTPSQEIYIYNNIDELENNIVSDTDMFDEVFGIELMSRVQGTVTDIDIYKSLLNKITNKYWQSIAALLIELNTGYDVDNYIIDEFYKFVK